jgi:Na+/glutamate symporter
MTINSTLLATLGAVIGIIVGSAGMWWSVKDRMTREIEERVTEKLTTSTRLTRLEERLRALDARTPLHIPNP